MYEMQFRIPENLNIDEIIRNNRAAFYGKNLKKEKLIFICDALINSRAQRRKQINEHGNQFVPLSSKILKEVLQDYRAYLDFLLACEIISTDNYWIEGEKCIGYCFNNPYVGRRLRVEKVNSYILKKANRRAIERRILALKKSIWGYRYLTKWWDSGKLKIDLEAAYSWLDEYERRKIQHINGGDYRNRAERINRAIETTEDFKLLCWSINNKKAHYSFSGRGHRFYNPITNLKKELRNFLTYDGQPLVEIDLKNSQPFLVSNLFKSSFWDSSEKEQKLSLRILKLKLDGYKIINNNNQYKDIIIFLKTRENLYQQGFDLKKYTNLVISGKFYDAIQEHFEPLFPDRFSSRSRVKQEVLRIFYVGNEKSKWTFYAPCITFQSLFPNVSALFKLIKEIECNYLPILLQRIESFLVLDIICKKIFKEDSRIPTLTIHDSIITTKGNEAKVKEIMLREIDEWTGYKPLVEINDLLPFKIAA